MGQCRLQETLPKVINRNEALLEAIESAETRAMETENSSVVALLRNLRARLAASHVPNASLRRDLLSFTGRYDWGRTNSCHKNEHMHMHTIQGLETDLEAWVAHI